MLSSIRTEEIWFVHVILETRLTDADHQTVCSNMTSSVQTEPTLHLLENRKKTDGRCDESDTDRQEGNLQRLMLRERKHERVNNLKSSCRFHQTETQ